MVEKPPCPTSASSSRSCLLDGTVKKSAGDWSPAANVNARSGAGGRGDLPAQTDLAPVTPPVAATWAVERVCGGAGTLHARGVPAAPFSRTVEILDAERPALVLGSTQRAEIVDEPACRAAGVDLARRASGGGVVLVDPADTLWVDVLLPAGDPLWETDVSRAARWLGTAWAVALSAVNGAADPVVHEGSMCLTRWGRLVCFAGLAAGEVADGAGGPKVVGISQRRSRWGARFQCAVNFGWDAPRLTGLLRWASDSDRDEATADLGAAGVVRTVEPHLRDPLLDAFLASLPS